MPPSGFKSVTYPKSVIEKFEKKYDKQKHLLECKGIFSFAGYMTYLANKAAQYEID